MGRLFKGSAATALMAVAAFFVAAFVVPDARAAEFHTYDFVTYIDDQGTAGEHAIIADFSIDAIDNSESLSITAFGSTVGTVTPGGSPSGSTATVGSITTGNFDTPYYTNPPYAYFDYGGAGIGVCQNATGNGVGQCNPNSDDNITGPGHYEGPAEVLSLGFSSVDTTGLANLLFRTEGHTASGLSDDHIYIGTGSMDLSTVTFTLYTLGGPDSEGIGAVMGVDADGNPFAPYDILANEFLHIMFADEQVYLAGLVTYPVPIPAALPLFLSGLAGLGFVGWRRKRTAE